MIMFESLPIPLLTHSTVLSHLQGYARPNDKINHLIQTGTLTRLQREMYLVNNDLGQPPPLNLIANQLVRPSYVSLQWAAQYYGWMTESVHQITSITTGRLKKVQTDVGGFMYHPVPERYYGVGVHSVVVDTHAFLIASPEKTLADILVSTRNLRIQSVENLMSYCEDFLRLDLDDLPPLDLVLLQQIASKGYKNGLLHTLHAMIQELQC